MTRDAPHVATIGNAQVTYLPGAGRTAVTLDVGAHMVVTNEAAARDLLAALRQVFEDDPLAESKRVVERVRALAGDSR